MCGFLFRDILLECTFYTICLIRVLAGMKSSAADIQRLAETLVCIDCLPCGSGLRLSGLAEGSCPTELCGLIGDLTEMKAPRSETLRTYLNLFRRLSLSPSASGSFSPNEKNARRPHRSWHWRWTEHTPKLHRIYLANILTVTVFLRRRTIGL